MVLFVAGAVGLPTSGIEDPTLGILGDASTWDVFVDRLRHMILPALTLGLVLYGDYALIVRSAMLETLGEDYVLTARAKGLSNWAIVRKHGFRNALLPIVTLIALSLGFIIGGSITIEYVFSYPGIGLQTVEAIDQRDWPLLQAIFLLLTLLRDLLQPDRRPPLREARPEGGRGVSVPSLPRPRSTSRPRRRPGGRRRRGAARVPPLLGAAAAGDDLRPRHPRLLHPRRDLRAADRAVRPASEDRRRLRAAVERALARHRRRRRRHALARHRGLAGVADRRLRGRARRDADRRHGRALVRASSAARPTRS